MPSGAKKRKAARRKRQQAMATPHPPPHSQPNPPPLPLSTPPVNGGVHDHDPIGHDESSGHHLTTDEEPEEDPSGSVAALVRPMDSSEIGKGEADEGRADAAIESNEEVGVQEVIISSPPPSAIPITQPEDVCVEFVQEPTEGTPAPTEIGSEKPAAEASVIPVVHSDSATKVGIQDSEAIAVTSEVAVDAPPNQDEAKAVDTAAKQPRDIERPGTAVTTEVTPAPLIDHRATWWNCCGLFDVLTGSQK